MTFDHLWYGQICVPVAVGNTGRQFHGICKYAGEQIVAHGPLVSKSEDQASYITIFILYK